jgi:hypothetical protein
MTAKKLILPTQKKHNHRSNEDLLREIEELKDENGRLKGLVASILRMLGEKL